MSPKLQALKDALTALDALKPHEWWQRDAALIVVERRALAAGFSAKRCMEDWARYTVAVGEVRNEVEEEPEPEQEALL